MLKRPYCRALLCPRVNLVAQLARQAPKHLCAVLDLPPPRFEARWHLVEFFWEVALLSVQVVFVVLLVVLVVRPDRRIVQAVVGPLGKLLQNSLDERQRQELCTRE